MIFPRNGKQCVTVYDPTVRRKVWIGTYDNEKAAKIAEGKALEAIGQRREKIETCNSFQARWTRDYPRTRRSTNDNYHERSAKFAVDFKGRTLDSVSRSEAREWVHANRGRHQAIRAMFSDAVRDGLCKDNPFTNMRLPGSRGRKDIVVVPKADVLKLAKKAGELRGPIFEAFVLCAAFTGMRPGELYALKWGAIDLTGDEIHVLESYSSKSGETTRPKNHRTRTAVLLPEAKAALLEIGPRPAEGFVFQTATGKRLTGRTLHYYWDPVRVACDYPGMAFYELRHFAASYLLNDLEVPSQDVAEQLGHTDGGTLVSALYGHPSALLARQRIKRAMGSSVTPIRSDLGSAAGSIGA